MVIFRENTEDIYAVSNLKQARKMSKIPGAVPGGVSQEYGKIRFPATSGIGIKPASREGSDRLNRAAIQYAITNQRKSVTFVHKGNI